SCSRGTVAQAIPRARHRAPGGGPGPGDGRRVCPRVGAGGAPVSSPRRRPRARGAARGLRHDELTVNFETYRFLIPRFWPDVAEEIAEAMDRLARGGTGAIIAVEGDIGLEEFISSGVPMEAKVSADLLTTIFTPYSPLHDGAVLVRGDRIIGAGCVLPLTQFK